MNAPAWLERGVEVVHRDRSLLVLYKPSGLPTTSPSEHEATLVQAAHALDPDAPRLHPSSRLDAEVSGLVTFARTPEATKYLLRAREQGLYHRAYVALCARAPAQDQGELDYAIGLDPRDPRKRRVVDVSAKVSGANLVKGRGPDGFAGGEGERRTFSRSPAARASRTRYRVLERREHGALLWLEPLTGRTHQLRVHLAHVGCPILGDRAYGGAQRFVLDNGSVISARRVMLHCFALSLPASGGEPARAFERMPPRDLASVFAAFGGPGHTSLRDLLEGAQ